MNGSNFMHWWINLVGSLATIALILTAFGIMLRIVKPDDVLKRIGAILGIVIVLMLMPGILVSAWSPCPCGNRSSSSRLGLALFNCCDRDSKREIGEGNNFRGPTIPRVRPYRSDSINTRFVLPLWTSVALRRMIWGIPLYPLKPAFSGRYGSLGIT